MTTESVWAPLMHAKDVAFDNYRFAEKYDAPAELALLATFGGGKDPNTAAGLRQTLEEAWFAAFTEADQIDLDGMTDDQAYRALYAVARAHAEPWNSHGNDTTRRVAARAVARDLVRTRNGEYVRGVAGARAIIAMPPPTPGGPSAHGVSERAEAAARAASTGTESK